MYKSDTQRRSAIPASLAPLMLIKQTLSHICSCYHNAVNNETFLSDFVSAFIFPPRNMISLSVMSFI